MRILLLLICLLFALPVEAETALQTVLVPEQTAQQYLSNRKILPWTDDGAARLIKNFDVTPDGRVALSFARDQRSNRACVGVYDRDGTFLWGLSYGTRNPAQVEWTTEGLLLHFTDYAMAVDAQANCHAVFEYADDVARNAHIRELAAPVRVIGGYRYVLRTASPLAAGYSTVARVTPDGTQELPLIYHRPSKGMTSGVLAVGAIVLVGIGCIAALRKGDQGPTVRKHL